MGLEAARKAGGEETGVGRASRTRAARPEERGSTLGSGFGSGHGWRARRGAARPAEARAPKEGFARSLVGGGPGAEVRPLFPAAEGRESLGDSVPSEGAVSCFLQLCLEGRCVLIMGVWLCRLEDS